MDDEATLAELFPWNCRPPVMPANQHQCPMCTWVWVPVWRAMCGRCFSILPWKFRIEYMHAYRVRVFHPVEWQEKQIEGRQWFLGRNIPDRRERE